ELPFRGTKGMLRFQVLNEEPRPPRPVNDKIPRDLETVCLKAMGKEPNGRLLAGMHLGLMTDLADVIHVGKQLVETGTGEGPAAPQAPFALLPALVDPAPAAQLLDPPLE